MAGYVKNLPAMHRRSEKNIEKYLREQIEKRVHGVCLKFASMTETGYPDRIVLLPGGAAYFFELKSKGEKPTRLQSVRHEQLRDLGFPVFVIDSKESVDEVINEMAL